MKKKLPPFGRQIKEKVQLGWQPPGGINIYTSWKMSRPLPHAVTFPPDASPDDYDWSFLVGQEISLINTEAAADYETLKALAVLLVKSGVKSVGLIDAKHPLQWFVPETKVRAA